ncbi:MAG: NAD(+) synthase [Defluviitaleaceae bacterium]|nr:NAD(+) synthase [Defluviitaleaceae bacterium]
MLNFIRAATALPKLTVADCTYNVSQMIELAKEAHKKQVQILVFPELCITGYTCGDLFFQSTLTEGAEGACGEFLKATENMDMAILISMPIAVYNQLFNCAALCHKGKILGIIPKMYLPNSGEFGECRWFSPAYNLGWDEISYCGQTVPMGNDILFNCGEKGPIIGVEICQDLWEPIPPSSYQALAGAAIILNPTASNEYAAKANMRREVITSQSARTVTAYICAMAGIWESTSALVFAGQSIIAENGVVLAENKRFEPENSLLIQDIDFELLQKKRQKNNGFMGCYYNGAKRDYWFIDVPIKINVPDKFVRNITQNPYLPDTEPARTLACEDIFNIQSSALMRRLAHIKANKCVLGISGGLDSALALLAAAKTMDIMGLDRKNIIGITMPGFGTTDKALKNAYGLMEGLGITQKEISIKEACLQHFKDIGHDYSVHDTVFENAQARERTQILMDIANKESGIVVGTADMSEIALGFSTFGGDHLSMYNVNCGVPKTIVRIVTKWIADTNIFGKDVSKVLLDILAMPVSPELLPPSEHGNTTQITEEILGPYEVNDFFMFHMLNGGFMPVKIVEMALHAFNGKYERDKLVSMLKNFYRLFFINQYKRSCAPDGPKAVAVSLAASGDWRMPSDASYNLWLKELE